MNNDKYKYLTVISLLILFVNVLFFRVAWIIPVIAVINAYTYYKRLQLIPRTDRRKAILPTIISIALIVLLLIVFNFWTV